MYPLSLRNERAVMETLLELVESKLKLYPTTLAQDRRLLGQATSSGSGDCESVSTSTTTASSSEGGGGGGAMSLPPFSNKRHAVIQVAGEKEVLEHYKKLATTALELLAWPLDDDAGLLVKLQGLEVGGPSTTGAAGGSQSQQPQPVPDLSTKFILKYVSADPRAVLGYCRRMERRKTTTPAGSSD